MSTPKPPIRLLLVDDDETFRRVMSTELSRRGYAVVTAAAGREAIERATATELDVILLDLRLPDLDGIEVLKELGARGVGAGVIVLTGHGTIDTAIQAVRLGAFDYLEKPSPMEKVEMAIQKTHRQAELSRRKRVLEDGFSSPDVGGDWIGVSTAFDQLRDRIDRFAPLDATVLILGETGVGKEMVAKLLHSGSARADAPFVVVDCACLREELLQSELFGHEKGSFTGANRQKHGLFEVADGGSIFLDEIGDTSREIQAKLLRVLETGRFRRLGGTREIAVDVRVISATNRDLRRAAARGHFREDLFFRLSPLTVEVPPLRERVDDVQVLLDHFTEGFNSRFGRRTRLSAEASESLSRYHWPGNVRELIHVVEQLIVLAERDEIDREDLPDRIVGREATGAPPSEPMTLAEVERRHVLDVLDAHGGNRARSAAALGISERNLYRLLKRYGDGRDERPSPED